MAGDPLYHEALNLYDFSGILRLIHVSENKTVPVFACKLLEGVFTVRIKSNDDIPDCCVMAKLNQDQIVRLNAGVDHGIALGPDKVELPLAEN